MKTKIIVCFLFMVSIQTTEAQIWKKITGNKKETDTTKTEKQEKKSGGGFFQKVITKVTKAAGGLVGNMAGAISTVDNLQNVDILASVGTNIYSKDLGLVVNDFLGDEWINSGDFSMIMLTSKGKYQFNKYAGTIKVNGKEIKHASYGIYTVCENPNSGSKKFSFEKNGVEEGAFEIPLPKQNIKLLSVNGQKSNVNVDLTKDVTLEFANYSNQKDALIRVDIVCTTIGIRSLYLVAYVKPSAKVVVPYQAFRNIETTNKSINFKNSYIAISEQFLVKTINNTGFFKQPIDALTGSNDGMWVNVSNSNEQFQGYKTDVVSNEIKGSITKGNASFSMPVSMAKNIAVGTMNIQGITQIDGRDENKLQGTVVEYEFTFPQIPDAWNDEVLSKMYQIFTATLSEVFSSEVLPENTVPNAPSYKNVQDFFLEEKNATSNFSKSYKGLNPIIPLSTFSIRLQGENALLSETKSDAILKVKMHVNLIYDKGQAYMHPFLFIDLDGLSNGNFRSTVGNTKYFQIVLSGAKIKVTKKTLINKEFYDSIVQLDEFNIALRKALFDLKAKEQSNSDYEVIWKLQK
jgi:hypothetical protein